LGGKTGPFPTVRVFLVVRPVAKVLHREESDPEPAWQFTPVSNTTTNQPQANRILLEANCQKDGAGQLSCVYQVYGSIAGWLPGEEASTHYLGAELDETSLRLTPALEGIGCRLLGDISEPAAVG
jgi:hypothetical protein